MAEKALTLKEVENQLAAAPSIKSALTLDFVRTRAIKNYEAVTGRKDGDNKFEAELFAYMEVINEKPDLQKVDRMYHMGAMVKCLTTNLSFRDNLLYVMPTKNGGIKVQPSPAGRRIMMENMKTIKRVPEPQIVLKGDKFVHDKLNNIIKEHETTEDTVKKIILDNIVASYTRIKWADGTIEDVVVYHDDLVKAKAKSPAQSDVAFWNTYPGEAAKKTSVNRAFRLYHKYPESVVLPTVDKKTGRDRDDDDDGDYTPHEVVPSGVDAETGEVLNKETEGLDLVG
jgi:recombinational DNA repair protein RecT